MVKTNDVLEPGEQVIKESSSGPFTQVTYVKSLMSNVQGKLVLTNQRIIFLPGNFQNTDSTILVLGRMIKSPDTVHIHLPEISKVEKGWGEQITIYEGAKKHDFRGMRNAGEWASAIEQARASPASAPPVQQRAQAPPAPRAVGGKFCNNCGNQLRPQDKFCPNCGASGAGGPASCPSCGNAVEPGQKFCNSCGAKL